MTESRALLETLFAIGPTLFASALRRGFPPADVHDAFQDVALQCLKRPEVAQPARYLAVAFRNRLVHHYRRRKDHLSLAAASHLPSQQPDRETAIDRKSALRRLSSRERAVLYLSNAGYTSAEIATLLAAPSPSAVRQTASRARLALRPAIN